MYSKSEYVDESSYYRELRNVSERMLTGGDECWSWLNAWLTEQVEGLRDEISGGHLSPTEYQNRCGLVEAYQNVLRKPELAHDEAVRYLGDDA